MPVTGDDRQGKLSRAGAIAALAAVHAAADSRSAFTPAAAPLRSLGQQATPSRNSINVDRVAHAVGRFLTGKTNLYGQRVGPTTAQAAKPLYTQNGRTVTVGQAYQQAQRQAHLMSMYDSPMGYLGLGKLAVAQLGNDLTYNPSGVYHEAIHPIGTGEAIAKSTWDTLSNPLKHPGEAALLAYGGASGLAGLRDRLIRAGAADGPAAKLQALASRPVGGTRTIYNPKGDATLALTSDNPLARPGQRLLDRVAAVNKPGLQLDAGSARTGYGLRNAYQYHRFRVHQQRADTLGNKVADAQPSSLGGRVLGTPTEPTKLDTSPYTADLMTPFRVGNRLSRATVLYGKLGYGPTNEIGNEWLGLNQQGALAPVQRVRQMLLRRQMTPLGTSRLDALSGTGEVRASQTPLGKSYAAPVRAVEAGVDTLDRAMGGAYARVIDTPQRRAALVHELRRGGIKGAAATERALSLLSGHVHNLRDGHITDPIPTGDARKALEAGLRSNQALINYDTLGPLGQQMRDVAFFAPWLKGSSLYLGHYLRDHPLQAALAAQMGRVGQQKAGLGNSVPSIMDGMFAVGHRNVPGLGRVKTAINPTSSSILSQPVQLGQMGASILGLTPNKPGFDPTGTLTPMLYSGVAAVTHKDPFTGHTIPQNQGWPQIFANEYANMIPAYTAYKGGALHGAGIGPAPKSQNPTKYLFPRTPMDKVWQFAFGGLAPTPVNSVEQQSRYRAETTAAASKQGAINLRSGWFANDLLQGLNRADRRAGKPPLTQLPQDVRGSINVRKQLLLEQLKVKKMLPNLATQHGTLNALGSAYARYRVWATLRGMPQAQIDRAAKLLAAVPPQNQAKVAKQLSAAVKDLTPALAIASNYAKQLNTYDPLWFPYANGGAPITVPSTR